MRRLPALSRGKFTDRPLLPREVEAEMELVPVMWKRAVFLNTKLPQGAVDRDTHVVCVLEQPHRALNGCDVFAAPSNRWADPRARLPDETRWEAIRADVLAVLSLTEDADQRVAQLTPGAWTRRDGRWPTGSPRPATSRRWRSSSLRAAAGPACIPGLTSWGRAGRLAGNASISVRRFRVTTASRTGSLVRSCRTRIADMTMPCCLAFPDSPLPCAAASDSSATPRRTRCGSKPASRPHISPACVVMLVRQRLVPRNGVRK